MAGRLEKRSNPGARLLDGSPCCAQQSRRSSGSDEKCKLLLVNVVQPACEVPRPTRLTHCSHCAGAQQLRYIECRMTSQRGVHRNICLRVHAEPVCPLGLPDLFGSGFH